MSAKPKLKEINKLGYFTKNDIRREKQDDMDIALIFKGTYQQEWSYDELNGVWREWTGNFWQEQKDDCNLLQRLTEVILRSDKVEKKNVSPRKINTVLSIAKNQMDEIAFLPQANLVNFTNGTLDTETMQLRPHDPHDALTTCLPYDFKPGNHSKIDLFLSDTLPDKMAIDCFKSHIGLVLMKDTSLHYALLILGPPRAGKSSLMALANLACGDLPGCAGPNLFNRGNEGKSSRIQWNKNAMVCIDELPVEALRSEEIFKIMTAHGGTEMRELYKSEHKQNTWMPKLILSTNEAPHYKDTSGAIGHRLIILRAPNYREERTRNRLLIHGLMAELPAFVATCILAGKQTLDRGYYLQSENMRNELSEIAKMGNPLKSFINDCCEVDPLKTIDFRTLHESYTEYCRENGNIALSGNKLTMALCEMNLGIEQVRTKIAGCRVRALKGICLKGKDIEYDNRDSWDSSGQLNKINCPQHNPIISNTMQIPGTVGTVKSESLEYFYNIFNVKGMDLTVPTVPTVPTDSESMDNKELEPGTVDFTSTVPTVPTVPDHHRYFPIKVEKDRFTEKQSDAFASEEKEPDEEITIASIESAINKSVPAQEKTFEFSLFDNSNDNEPKRCCLTFEQLIQKLSIPINIRSVKDAANGSLFSPAIYNFHPVDRSKPKRNNSNVLALSMMVFDFDEAVTMDEAAKQTEMLGAKFMLYTTFNHSDELDKFRIVIPLLRNISPQEHKTLWYLFNENVYGGKVDLTCKDPSRMYWLSALSDKNAPFRFASWSNSPLLDPDQFDLNYIAEMEYEEKAEAIDSNPLPILTLNSVSSDARASDASSVNLSFSSSQYIRLLEENKNLRYEENILEEKHFNRATTLKECYDSQPRKYFKNGKVDSSRAESLFCKILLQRGFSCGAVETMLIEEMKLNRVEKIEKIQRRDYRARVIVSNAMIIGLLKPKNSSVRIAEI